MLYKSLLSLPFLLLSLVFNGEGSAQAPDRAPSYRGPAVFYTPPQRFKTPTPRFYFSPTPRYRTPLPHPTRRPPVTGIECIYPPFPPIIPYLRRDVSPSFVALCTPTSARTVRPTYVPQGNYQAPSGPSMQPGYYLRPAPTYSLKSEEAAGAIPYLECVYDLGNGRYRAYFGYDNPNSYPVEIPVSGGTYGSNRFSPGPAHRGQINRFNPGRVHGAFAVDFDGQPIEWSIAQRSGRVLSAHADKKSAACAPIRPIIECADSSEAVFGYHNDNRFTVTLPTGIHNYISPAPIDRSQPTEYFSGRVNNVFSTSLSAYDKVEWRLGSQKSTAIPGAKRCHYGPLAKCSDAQMGRTISRLEYLIESQETALQYAAYPPDLNGLTQAYYPSGRALISDFKNELSKLPKHGIVCASTECERIDLEPQYKKLRDIASQYYRKAWPLIHADGMRSIRSRRILVDHRRDYNAIISELKYAPRFLSDCRPH